MKTACLGKLMLESAKWYISICTCSKISQEILAIFGYENIYRIYSLFSLISHNIYQLPVLTFLVKLGTHQLWPLYTWKYLPHFNFASFALVSRQIWDEGIQIPHIISLLIHVQLSLAKFKMRQNRLQVEGQNNSHVMSM